MKKKKKYVEALPLVAKQSSNRLRPQTVGKSTSSTLTTGDKSGENSPSVEGTADLATTIENVSPVPTANT